MIPLGGYIASLGGFPFNDVKIGWLVELLNTDSTSVSRVKHNIIYTFKKYAKNCSVFIDGFIFSLCLFARDTRKYLI